MKYFLVLFLFIYAPPCLSESSGSEAELHLAAHLGVSYALDTMVQGFSEKALHMSPLQSETFAAFTTAFIGVLYEAQENAAPRDMLRASWQNGLGIGAAILTRMMFKWQF